MLPELLGADFPPGHHPFFIRSRVTLVCLMILFCIQLRIRLSGAAVDFADGRFCGNR